MHSGLVAHTEATERLSAMECSSHQREIGQIKRFENLFLANPYHKAEREKHIRKGASRVPCVATEKEGAAHG